MMCHSATAPVAHPVADFFHLLLSLSSHRNKATAILETRTRGRADDEATSTSPSCRGGRVLHLQGMAALIRKIAVAVFQTMQGAVLAVGITLQGAPHALWRCSS
jgi:hypothetical protein